MDVNASVILDEASRTHGDMSAVITFLQQLRELERTNLARVLHDDLGGSLVSAVMDMAWLEQHFKSDSPACTQRLNRVRTSLRAAIDLKRNIIEELRPSLLDNFGLFAAFRWHVKQVCARAGVRLSETYPEDEIKWRPEALTAYFRIVQELLVIVLAEAAVLEINVAAAIENEVFTLCVGHIHENAEPHDFRALHGPEMGAIEQRVFDEAGLLTVETGASGTLIHMRFPMARARA